MRAALWRMAWKRKQRARLSNDEPPGETLFATEYGRRSLAQARLFLRPVLFVADGTIDAGDRMLLARRYGREN